jgi:hypothetical protein
MSTEASQVETVEFGLADAVLQAWKRCVGLSIPLFGKVEGCVEVDASPSGQITITLEIAIGSHRWKWSFQVDGDRCFKVGTAGPVSAELCVSGWKVESHAVSLHLQLYVILHTPIGDKRFLLIDQTVTIPLPLAEEVEGLASMSAEDSLLTLALLGAEVEEPPAEPVAVEGATLTLR